MRLPLDPDSGTPLWIQLADGIREAIASGELSYGSPAPSLRTLAADLRVNYHTIARAYHALEDEGTLVRQRGGAYVVGSDAGLGERLLQMDLEALCRRAHAFGVSEDALCRMLRSVFRVQSCG